MSATPRLDYNAFPDSAYAAELRRGFSKLRFGARLEAEYVRAFLINGRAIIRAACVFAVVVAILRGIEQAGIGQHALLVPTGLIALASMALAAIAWSPAFERLFMPTARVVVPVRNSILGFFIAAAAAAGRLEMLLILAPALVAPFFFLGLRFRAALVCAAMTLASFALGGIFFELPLPLALRSCIFLSITLAACAIAAARMEMSARRSFLETRLLAEIAEHDTLTGAKNRRMFDDHLAQLWPRMIEERKSLAVLLIDVDHFKAYNDRYGHQAGDETLRRVAQALRPFVDGSRDVLARYGGEEFAAVVPHVDAARAMDLAERMRAAIQKLGIEHRGSRTSSAVTISVGVALVEPSAARTPRGALQLADQALYQAKVNGRNRVELKNEVEHEMLVTGVFLLSEARSA